MKYWIPVLAAAILFLGFKGATVRRDLVAERQSIDTYWVEVETALEGRAAIVPDLAQTVGAEAPGESAAIHEVSEACQALHGARSQQDKMQANAHLDDALSRLMLEVENYPKLESSKKYASLLDTLKDAEYQIAVARRKYNEAVEHYNARLLVFPDNVVASLGGLHKIDAYFQTPAI